MASIFDVSIDRRHTGACKWDGDETELPMWVADMDFKSPEPVIRALKKRIDHGVYGYTEPEESWAKAYVGFYRDLYHYEIHEKDLHFVFSVVASVYAAVGAFTEEGDEVVLMTPVYHHFFTPVTHQGRFVREVPLRFDGLSYSIDFSKMEEAFSLKKVKLCILCNPHNPTGTIYEKEDLIRLVNLAKKHNVTIFSDEIHGPISRPGHPYVPFLSVEGASEVGVSALSPSKAFNLAGLHTAAMVLPNPKLATPVLDYLNRTVYEDPNVLSCIASTVAYNEGREWLKEMNEYVYANRLYCESFLEGNPLGIKAIHGEATYLLWVDCRAVCGENSKEFSAFLREKTGLRVSSGEAFGQNGKGFLRLNLATSLERVKDGMKRLLDGAALYLKKQGD